MPNWKEGQRVKLKANAAEGWHEEHGEIEGVDLVTETCIVRVDSHYWDPQDDGLREVSFDQLEAE